MQPLRLHQKLLAMLYTLNGRVLTGGFVALLACVGTLWLASELKLQEAAQERTQLNLASTYASAKQRLTQFHEERWNELSMVQDELESSLPARTGASSDGEGLSSSGASPALDDLLRRRRDNLRYFSELFVIDDHGKILHSTEPSRVGSLEGRRVALRPIEDGAPTYLDGPYWDDVTTQLGATTSAFHDGATLMYTVPLRSDDAIRGYLMARMPADVQADQLQSGVAHIYQATGDTYLFAARSTAGLRPGTALSRSRFEDDSLVSGANLKDGIATEAWGTITVENATEFELILRDPATGELTHGVRNIIDNDEVSLTDVDGYFDYRHVSVVGVGGTMQAPGSPDVWGLITEANVDDVYATTMRASKQVAQLAGLAVIVSLVALGLLVVRPLHSLRMFVGDVKTASESVNDTASSLGRSANSLSASATDQAAAIAETMASMEEITAMVSSNNDAASEALTIAQSALESAGHGSEVVAELSNTMQAIAEQNAQLAQVVEIIENISDKTKVINDIVFETKLLSFNASIEAARAGNQGKGFAVVAEEVGNLARLSGKAAQEIHTLIEQSTKQVHSMVSVTKTSISKGLSVSQRCSEAFDSINEGVSKVSTMMDAIALSSSEQQQGISQVAKAMSQMDTLTQNTAVAAADAAMQSDSLRDSGNHLKTMVTSLQLLVGAVRAKADDEAMPKRAKTQETSKNKADRDEDDDDFLSGANDSDYDPEAAGIGEVPDLDDAAFK